MKTPLTAAKPATPSFPAGRRRPSQQSGGASAAAPASILDTSDSAVTTLDGHPELGANGEMIRRPSRSVVAEAHRKALQRRESERDTATARRHEQLQAAVSTMYQPTASSDDNGVDQPHVAPGEVVRAAQPVRMAIPASAPLPTASDSFAAAPLRATNIPAPTLPPATLHEGLDRSIAPDRPIAPERSMMPTVRTPLHADLTSKPAREELAVRPIAPPPAEDVEAPLARSTRRISAPLPSAPITAPVEAAPANDVRYWDQPGANGRFARMRQESNDPVTPRPNIHTAETLTSVPTVGRSSAEPTPMSTPLPVEAPVGRTIRPLQPLATFSADTAETLPAAPRAPRVVAPPEPRPVELVKPTLPPRQVDSELLRQLQSGWRERALAEREGQRCGTCRFFQVAEGAERGTCGCTFATNSYRQPLSRTDLGCLDSVSVWWAATDDGWLQKTDLGPRRQTPLLDQLLEEMGGAEAISAINERRRGTR